MVKESNVLSWNDVLREGIDLSGYDWKNSVPHNGSLLAKLNYKVWCKNVAGIRCYFHLPEIGAGLQLTLFRLKDKNYRLPDGNIYFRTCPTGKLYRLSTKLNGKGKLCLETCDPVSD